MRKYMKYILTALSIFIVMLLCSPPLSAQTDNPVLDQAVASGTYDPIAATLDSLVNLNYIQRLSFASSGTQQVNNFQPFEVPAYADDIYRKRIEKIQTPIPLAYNREVQEYIDMYAMRKRGLTERVMGLANLYFPLYEQIFDQQGLPLEFKYLSIVESALNPTAVSRVGATGLWQFMLATGKMYKLKVNSYIDERRDPVKSTMAAAQYFKDMYSIYNDWLLVIAAYNCGAGNVNRAIARSGGKKTFWEISPYLPRETRGYVPAFIAVTYLMNYSSEHNLSAVPPVISFFEADTVLVDRKMQLRDIADAINVPVELLTYLNPVYKKGVIPDADEPMALRLPTSKINTYIASIDNIYQQQESSALASISVSQLTDAANASDDQLVKKYHKVRSGEHLQSIANRYSCSVTELKRWNHLKSTRLKAGQKLTVFVMTPKKPEGKMVMKANTAKENSTIASAVKSDSSNKANNQNTVTASLEHSQNPTKQEDSNSKYIYHVVQPGDTLWKIAQRYEGMTVESIKQINQLHSNELKVGTKLKVTIGG